MHIIRDSPVYPVIYDSNGVVLSLPPIINGDHSKINLNTRDVFIECTATDWTKANIAVKLIVQAFSLYSSTPGQIEQVEVTQGDGKVTITPDISERPVSCDLDFMNIAAGISVDRQTCIDTLKKMGLHHTPNTELSFQVPYFRTDILHQCDVAEDLAIGYGYHNIKADYPPINTVGKGQSINNISDIVREELAHCGYNECLNFALCSFSD